MNIYLSITISFCNAIPNEAFKIMSEFGIPAKIIRLYSLVRIEVVKKMIFDNSRITIKEVADDVGISFGSFRAIFIDVFGMKQAVGQVVSKFLNF